MDKKYETTIYPNCDIFTRNLDSKLLASDLGIFSIGLIGHFKAIMDSRPIIFLSQDQPRRCHLDSTDC